MKNLRDKYLRLINYVNSEFKRYLFEEIQWTDRLIIIRGQRGVGKTTLILQYLKYELKNLEDSIYISLDDIYFSKTSLSDFVEEFVVNGGKYLFIDEVHRYKNWSVEIKNIYDFYPDLKIVITGSSAIDLSINTSDLSRRASVYYLNELSFREFLELDKKIKIDSFDLENILKNHLNISSSIIGDFPVVKYFNEYLKNGAFPFAHLNEGKYFDKLESTIKTVIFNDIPSFENITYNSQLKLSKLLISMATSKPYKVNIKKLSELLDTSRDMLMKYLSLLSNSGIINLLGSEGVGNVLLRKPEKVYLSNTNYLIALNANAETGTIRETFFLNQLSVKHKVNYSKSGDFLVDDKYTFEIGGKNKTKKQIAGIENSFLALDNMETGFKGKIPLYLFGLLY